MQSLRRQVVGTVVLVLVTWVSGPVAQGEDDQRFWPSWRGPLANGVSATARPPVEWSETKTDPVPGRRSQVDRPRPGPTVPRSTGPAGVDRP